MKYLGAEYVLHAWFVQKNRGFTLIDMAILLVILGSLMVIAIGIVPQYFQRQSLLHSQQALLQADSTLRGFTIDHARLPCPDSNGDGLENCGSIVGTLPWKTLALSGENKDETLISLRYASYVNSSLNIDLSTSKNSFIPAIPGGQVAPANINGLDFCQSLVNASNATLSNAAVSSGTGASQRNVAYALAAPGFSNADRLGSVFDGLNGGTTAAFESATQVPSDSYDDLVLIRDFSTLFEQLSCRDVLDSMAVMAEVYDFTDAVNGNAIKARDDIIFSTVLDVIGTALVVVDVVMSLVDVASAVAATSAASAALSGAIASCFVLVGCGFIPGYILAVAAGVAGVAAAGVATGLNVAASVAQVGVVVLRGIALDAAITQVNVTGTHLTDAGAWMSRMDAAGTVR